MEAVLGVESEPTLMLKVAVDSPLGTVTVIGSWMKDSMVLRKILRPPVAAFVERVTVPVAVLDGKAGEGEIFSPMRRTAGTSTVTAAVAA